ncbi:hypothetical protein ACFL6X_05455 [Candidatus Latescibacterota bacterium]
MTGALTTRALLEWGCRSASPSPHRHTVAAAKLDPRGTAKPVATSQVSDPSRSGRWGADDWVSATVFATGVIYALARGEGGVESGTGLYVNANPRRPGILWRLGLRH